MEAYMRPAHICCGVGQTESPLNKIFSATRVSQELYFHAFNTKAKPLKYSSGQTLIITLAIYQPVAQILWRIMGSFDNRPVSAFPGSLLVHGQS